MEEGIQEKIGVQVEALKFLYEIELLDDPNLINNLKLNILSRSPSILDTEILAINQEDKKEMLIWVKLSWWGNKFKKEAIIFNVETTVLQLLPNFKIRVISDKTIFDMAVENVIKFFKLKKAQESIKK